MQQATWLKGQNGMCIFAAGQVWVPTQEGKTICALVEGNCILFYMIIVLREKNHAWFELLNKIFQLFNMMWCIPPGQSVYGQAKKGIIYAWIVHRWIRNCWIVYCELAQPIFFSKILQKIRQQNSFQTSFCFFERALCELEALGQYN